jgi:hypothetical protein
VKRIFVLAFILFSIFISSSNAFAAYPYFSTENNGLTTGISGVTIKYFLTSGAAANRLNTDIPNSVDKWVNTTSILWTPLWMQRTSTQSVSQMDFYSVYWIPDMYGNTTLGQATHYVNNVVQDPRYTDWYWAKIEINSYSNFSKHKSVEATSSHEIGHALGLAHQNDTPSSILAQDWARTTSVIRASKTDLQNLVNLY